MGGVDRESNSVPVPSRYRSLVLEAGGPEMRDAIHVGFPVTVPEKEAEALGIHWSFPIEHLIETEIKAHISSLIPDQAGDGVRFTEDRLSPWIIK